MTRFTAGIVCVAVSMLSLGCERKDNAQVQIPATTVPKPQVLPSAIVTVPTKYDGKKELPVVVTLHGMGSKPTDFLGDEYGELADDLQAVIVAVSGPIPTDRGSFDWSDDVEVNLPRINSGLGVAMTKAKLRKDRVVLMGYSQGAYAALGLAYAHPELFAGTIAVSPGSLTNPALAPRPSPLLAKRGFVLCYGGKDEADFIRQGKERLNAAKRAGAKVEVKEYPDAEHLIPPDRDEVFPKWFEFILRANDE